MLPTLKKVRGYVVGKNGAYAGAIISIGNETVFFGRDPQQCQNGVRRLPAADQPRALLPALRRDARLLLAGKLFQEWNLFGRRAVP